MENERMLEREELLLIAIQAMKFNDELYDSIDQKMKMLDEKMDEVLNNFNNIIKNN
jgi:hypothetical protein